MKMTGETPGSEGFNVYLDDVILPYVIEADDVEGYALCTLTKWAEGVPIRTLDAENARTGEPILAAFAIALDWDRQDYWDGCYEDGDNPFLHVIVRGKVEFRRAGA